MNIYKQLCVLALTLPITPLNAAEMTAENTGNPSISVVGIFAGSSMNGGDAVHRDEFLPLSESEFIFAAEVDAYTRLDITATAADGAMAVEEGYLTSKLPQGFRVRAGLKFIPFGRANEVHPHALVFADTPNGLVNMFGAEKFTGEGLFIDHPLYIGDSAHSLLFGFFQNQNDVAFNANGDNEFSSMVRWKGVWDINDTSTFELGSTYINGKNSYTDTSRTEVSSIHFALMQHQFDGSGWSVQGEWNQSRLDTGVSQQFTDGAYLLGEYDYNRNWLSFARYDFSQTTGTGLSETAYSAGLAWKISEFQNITLQYKHTKHALAQTAAGLGIQAGQNANEVFFRWVVAIGPHKAHSY